MGEKNVGHLVDPGVKFTSERESQTNIKERDSRDKSQVKEK